MEPTDQDESRQSPKAADLQSPRFSTSAQIAGIIGVVATLCAGMLWLSEQRTASSTASNPPSADAGPTPGSPASGSPRRADANAKRPSTSTPSATKKPAEKTPPKVILDWIDYGASGCERTYAIGVNVIEVKGQVDSVTLVWRVKEKDREIKRRIYRTGKQWTAYIQGLPSDTDVQLLAIVKGPGGESTLAANVSRYC